MLDEAATAIVTGAAGNVVAHLLNGRVEGLRARLAGMFATKDSEGEHLAALLRALEDDRAALAERRRGEAEVRVRWTALLAAHLAGDPDAAEHLRALAAEQAVAKTVMVGSQHNWGSGTFIGGDNYGPVGAATPGTR